MSARFDHRPPEMHGKEGMEMHIQASCLITLQRCSCFVLKDEHSGASTDM